MTLLREGCVRIVIGKLLGHSKLKTTARYAHHARDSAQEAAERVAESIAEDLCRSRVLPGTGRGFGGGGFM